MSEAVRYALEILDKINIDKKFLKDERFHYSLAGFIYSLHITQGDYRVVGLNSEGNLVIEFTRLTKEETNDATKLISKPNIEEYAKRMVEVLKYAIGEDGYKIKVDWIGKRFLQKNREKIEKLEDPEEILLMKRIHQSISPIFEIYSNEKLHGRLYRNYFVLTSTDPEALYVMEKIGRRVFECRKDKLTIDTTYLGTKNLEEWLEELVRKSSN